MIVLLFSALVAGQSVDARVIECPKVFPSSEVEISALPSGHNARARVLRARLSHAFIYSGEIYGEQLMVPPGSSKVGGSWDAAYDFRPEEKNWLVCSYGGSAWGEGRIELWKSLVPTIAHCVLKVRELKERSYPTRWTAAAVCK